MDYRLLDDDGNEEIEERRRGLREILIALKYIYLRRVLRRCQKISKKISKAVS